MAATFGGSARLKFLDALWACANITSETHPFSAIFDVENGNYINGTLR